MTSIIGRNFIKKSYTKGKYSKNGAIQIIGIYSRRLLNGPRYHFIPLGSYSTVPRNGPDQVLDADTYRSTHPDVPVRLQVQQKGKRGIPPVSMPTLLKDAANNYKEKPALLSKVDGKWKSWTYRQFYEDSRSIAKAFIKLGLERFGGVCIMSIPSPEWNLAYFGAINAGGISAGIYTTNSAEACQYIAKDSKSNIAVVQNQEMAKKFLEINPNLPLLKKIIQVEGSPASPEVMMFEDLVKIGELENDEELEERLSQIAINQCCSLIYTSGTTGPPKGVMCSHDNLTWTAKFYHLEYLEKFGPPPEDAGYVSYLPLNHIAGQIGMPMSIDTGTLVYHAEPDAMQGSLLKTIVDVQPITFYSVPRLWEKMHAGVNAKMNELPPSKKKFGEWALRQGFNHTKAGLEGRKLSVKEKIQYRIADKAVLSNIRTQLGLSNAVRLTSIAAPITQEVLEYFMSLGVVLTEAYGMSETMTICTSTHPEPGKFKLGTVGKAYEENDVKIDESVCDIQGEGEICMKGRNICMGYLRNPEATNKTIDEEGWLRSGDLGKFDEEDFLILTGRLKELIITAGGENIPPIIIEDKIKKHLPILSNVMLIGDRRKYLSMLLTIKTDLDPSTGAPKDTLTCESRNIVQNLGYPFTTLTEVRAELEKNPSGALATHIQNGIDQYNNNDAESRVQKVQKWVVLPHDFSLETLELNNTLKLKRSFVLEKYSDFIEQMYSE